MTSRSPEPDPAPGHVFLMGDVHGNLPWVLHALDVADELFTRAGETRRIVIQLGDFGFRPMPGNPDLAALDRVLIGYGMELWFIDGNHDYHPDLRAMTTLESQFDNYPPGSARLLRHHRIRYLPRGTRWTWHGRTWLAVGGAVSVDRLARTEGVDWWPTEEITPEQAQLIQSQGPADVLLSHDCPADWYPWDKLAPRDKVPRLWIPELPRAAAHASRLNGIARSVGVTRVYHGHLHVARYDNYFEPEVDGEIVLITGLDMDGSPGNYQLVDVERGGRGLRP